MQPEFKHLKEDIPLLLEVYLSKLSTLGPEIYAARKNKQNRSIKEIVGHMIDSASNNTHRIIHLQYRKSPLEFPDYATEGNNDRWIAIQNFQDENWESMLQLWKYIHLHILHVIENISPDKLTREWIAGPGKKVSLKDMVIDFLPHFKLHIAEIDELKNHPSTSSGTDH